MARQASADRGAADQFSRKLTKILFESSRGNDLQYARRRSASVPERLPLLARFDDQIPGIADRHGVSEQRPTLPSMTKVYSSSR
jgi:hypothetical protein